MILPITIILEEPLLLHLFEIISKWLPQQLLDTLGLIWILLSTIVLVPQYYILKIPIEMLE